MQHREKTYLFHSFVAAGALSIGNLLLALLLLPESCERKPTKIALSVLNPLKSLSWALSSKKTFAIMMIFSS
ncbi:hypothetical protein [Vibrio ziniensis]|uniref:Uncharacterized protein n=1 Tax=Vibrio ziniensis TaxID=2711221 RepID=A0A6G7CP96_9VIBR|nr:hypothetical protein [Vibrio ziniensis]QIH43904.1 hypothetical protein G5S32_18150 [Vibrio ziniensis]